MLKKKRILAVIFSTLMWMMSCMPAFARSYKCDVCGTGTVNTYITQTGWQFQQLIDCSHVKGGHDAVYVNTYTSVEKCDFCGVSYKTSWVDTKTEHYSNN